MKHFIICSLLAALPFAVTQACVPEAPTHNRYMFSVFKRGALADGPSYLADINSFWADYAGSKSTDSYYFYRFNGDDIMKTAKRKGDREMTAYLNLLNRYLKACDDYSQSGWNYPSKQALAKCRQTFQSLIAASKAYSGATLRPQYVLLQMRANMMLGYDKTNITLWNTVASKLHASPWREAMRNIYARALMKSGQRQRACDIYAEQGDMKSIQFMMDNYRCNAGIRSVFAQNPNSPSLHYLVQDFVNNFQETLDQTVQGNVDDGWLAEIGARKVLRKDALAFVQLAKSAASDSRVKSPSLWLAAASMVDYLLGNQRQAMAEADLAVRADGTPRMKDNARAIRLLVSTRSGKLSKEYSDYLVGEFRWLDSMAVDERGGSGVYDNHYSDVKDRVVHKGLIPLYRASGNENMALALCAMMSAEENGFMSQDGNIRYSPWNEYADKLDTLTADRLADYYGYISSAHGNAFEAYCTQRVYRGSDYFNDFIGTKMIAEGRFADAIQYLEKVSLAFLSKQNISVYAANRHFDTPRWFGKQHVDADDYTPVTVRKNVKLDYCRDMVERLSRYGLAREGAAKQSIAYELAVRYYQASCYGDCWFLTHYYHSVSDSARSWEKDFAQETVKYLGVAKQSDDMQLRYHAIYALAFLPVEPWYSVYYDEKNDYNLVMKANRLSSQYIALSELDVFARCYPNVIDDYTRRCDVLRKFRQQ